MRPDFWLHHRRVAGHLRSTQRTMELFCFLARLDKFQPYHSSRLQRSYIGKREKKIGATVRVNRVASSISRWT